MWVLHTLQRTISLPPSAIDAKGRSEAMDREVVGQLQVLFRGKTLPDLGLCMEIVKIVERDEFEYKIGEAWPSVSVKFSAVFFLPHVDEVLPITPTCVSARGIWFRFGNLFANLFMGVADIDADLDFVEKVTSDGRDAYVRIVSNDEGEKQYFYFDTKVKLCLMRVSAVEFVRHSASKPASSYSMWVRLSMKNTSCTGPVEWYFDSYQGWAIEHDSAFRVTPALPSTWPEQHMSLAQASAAASARKPPAEED